MWVPFQQQQGKMNFHLTFIVLTLILILACVHKDSAIDTMPKLKKNVLNLNMGCTRNRLE